MTLLRDRGWLSCSVISSVTCRVMLRMTMLANLVPTMLD
jgi:hypothetical protein